MKYITLYTILFLALIQGSLSHAQIRKISGKVVENKTGKSLAFVNISYNNTGRGTTSNIDGDFVLNAGENIQVVKFSYIGYEPVRLSLSEIPDPGNLSVIMVPVVYDIREVEITPGLNPAHRIIKLAHDNRKINNPEKIKSFSYTSYNKLYFTIDIPEALTDTNRFVSDETEFEQDSGLLELQEFVDEQHLFLMESVSTRDFKFPDRNHEEIVASRVSGFNNPSFTLLATQIQSFSFYNEFITILNKNYLNPLSTGSTNKYLFILQDTMFTETNDSVFIISYEPKRGRNFEGLKGLLYINSNKYALQNVIAEAAEPKDIFKIRIQQKYEYIENKQWFPVQLNTDIIIGNPETQEKGMHVKFEANDNEVKLLGIGKSYITNILIEPELELKRFRSVEVRVDKNAHKKPADYWDQFRYMPLSERDTMTYHILDSIGKEVHLDRMFWIAETLFNGYIPLSVFNIDISSILDYSTYEGLRTGIGGETNDRLSEAFSVGGHVAYGTRDNDWKFGIKGRVTLAKRLNMGVGASYLDDVRESGGYDFFETERNFGTESLRRFMVEQKDIVRSWKTWYNFRTLQYFRVRLYFENSDITFGNQYLFRINNEQPNVFVNKAMVSELGINIRFAFKEKFMESPGRRISLGTRYPVLYANIKQGVDWVGGQHLYNKYEARLDKTFTTRTFGKSRFILDGGFVDGRLPYSILYSGRGSFRTFTIDAANSFGTMRMNEFLSDRFFFIFFKQNFGKLLLRSGNFQPEIVLVTNLGVGSLKNRDDHRNIVFNTMEKGYYESGILVNNMINQFFIGYGLGIYYRYGPYTLEKTIDNFAFKFTINARL